MQKQPEHLYEYAVVRYVPRVEREEFVNVGLIMMCKRRRWIKAVMDVNEARVSAFPAGVDIGQLYRQLDGFCKVATGGREAGEMGMLPVEERFRWLTAVRSSCLQTSRPHPGLTDDLEKTFGELFDELVK